MHMPEQQIYVSRKYVGVLVRFPLMTSANVTFRISLPYTAAADRTFSGYGTNLSASPVDTHTGHYA